MTQDDYAKALVTRLVAQGFFGGWDARAGAASSSPTAKAKVGLVYINSDYHNYYGKVLTKALADAGYPVAVSIQVPADQTGVAAGSSNAVLRFRAEGVTHVFNANFFSYVTATSQGYKPRYAVDDHVGPELLRQNIGKSQLHGSMGAGYLPSAEVPNPGDATPSAKRCRSIMAAGGQVPKATTELQLMYGTCDDFFLLQQAIERSGSVTAEGLRSGIESLGNSFVPSFTYRSTFGPGRHAAAGAVRDYRYEDACSCYRFPDSKLYPVG